MAYTVDVRYFNSFWLKKVTSSNESGWDGSDWPGLPWNPHSYPMYPFKGGEYKHPEYNVEGELYTTAFNWYVEESRIRGGFNMSGVDFGARAYMVADKPNQINKSSSLIYSGIYNSRTGVNNTNSFPTGQAITRSLDPINGSIQKIHTTESDLIIFQENKISKAPMNKSIIYSSEGVAVAPQSLVIGQTEPYLGEYGISRNPESLAVSGFRKYFADKDRGVILRLSRDGITQVSSYGMRDYFKDYLSSISEDWVKYTLNNCEPFNVTITSGVTPTPGLPVITGIGDEVGNIPYTISTTLEDDNPCSIQIGAGLELTDGTPIIDIETGDYAYIVDVVNNGASNYLIILSQLSPNSLQPINLQLVTQVNVVKFVKSKILGTWDSRNQNYVLSMQHGPAGRIIKPLSERYNDVGTTCPSYDYATIAFEESINGWVSFYTYHPDQIGSLKSNYYSFRNASIYKHYDESTPNNRSNFYGLGKDEANITLVFNPDISTSKNFQTINYEGSNGWEVNSLVSDKEGVDNIYGENQDQAKVIYSYDEGVYTENGITYRAGFNRKENKYTANLVNNSAARAGEVVYGESMSGVKGYFVTVKLSTDATTELGGSKELFSVSSNFSTSAH